MKNECEEAGENMKSGWKAIIENSSKTAEIHSEIAKNLTINPSSPVKMLEKFKRDNYQHRILNSICSLGDLKKTHEFRLDFQVILNIVINYFLINVRNIFYAAKIFYKQLIYSINSKNNLEYCSQTFFIFILKKKP